MRGLVIGSKAKRVREENGVRYKTIVNIKCTTVVTDNTTASV
jgi:hypothetical protein